MSGKYQAYPEYKNTEIEWLASIPANWPVFDGKHAHDWSLGQIGSAQGWPEGTLCQSLRGTWAAWILQIGEPFGGFLGYNGVCTFLESPPCFAKYY